MDRALRASLLAGAVAGEVGAILFGTLHWLVVFRTWEPLLIGVVFGPLAGIPAGWAFAELRRAGALPHGRAGGLAFGGLLYATLLPVGGAALAGGAIDPLAIDPARVLAYLLAALPVGLGLGRALGTRRTALALGVAAFAFSLTLGHNIPFFLAGVRLAKVWGVMLVVALGAGLALAAVESALRARARPAQT